ncbi:MAG TPA: hypothetical protein VGA55_08705 [Bacteroidota bacterium]
MRFLIRSGGDGDRSADSVDKSSDRAFWWTSRFGDPVSHRTGGFGGYSDS